MVISAHYVTCSKVFPSVLSHAFMPSVPHCTGNCSVTIYWDGTCRLRHHQGSFFFFPGRFTSTRVFRTLLLLTRSGATHGILTLQCLYGTKCFQGCTTAGTCKCLVCARATAVRCLLLCGVDCQQRLWIHITCGCTVSLCCSGLHCGFGVCFVAI